MNVTRVEEREWKKDDGTVTKVTDVWFDDGPAAPGYDLPSIPEVGKPLPDGWSVETAKSGKLYIKVPKAGKGGFGGGAAAWRNTEAGARFEARARAINTAAMQSSTTEEADAWLEWMEGKLSGSTVSRTDEAPLAGAPRSNIPAEPGEESAGTRAELVVEGSGDGFCPNYSDHSFVKLNGTMTCKKCGAVRM